MKLSLFWESSKLSMYCTMIVSNKMDRQYKLTFKKINRIDVYHRYLVTLCYRLFQFFETNQIRNQSVIGCFNSLNLNLIRNLSIILIVKSMNTSIMWPCCSFLYSIICAPTVSTRDDCVSYPTYLLFSQRYQHSFFLLWNIHT